MSNFRPVGYLLNTSQGIIGERGSGYDYVTAGNGLFVQCENAVLQARIQISHATVRGLPDLQAGLFPKTGYIPSELFEIGLAWMMQTPERERLFVIATGPDGYRIEIPEQSASATAVSYHTTDNAIAEFHSHGALPAFFSETDDCDEQGFRVYGVCGRLGHRPELAMRVGIYGHFGPAPWNAVFTQSSRLINLAAQPAVERPGT